MATATQQSEPVSVFVKGNIVEFTYHNKPRRVLITKQVMGTTCFGLFAATYLITGWEYTAEGFRSFKVADIQGKVDKVGVA